MSILITGLAVFVLIHMVPWSPGLRGKLVGSLGETGYKGVFALISFAGLGLIVYGKMIAPFVPVYEPSAAAAMLTKAMVLVGFVLFPASHMPTNIKRFTRHPMLWGMVLWSVGHLLSNGDLASIWLFGVFAVFSLAAMMSANMRGAQKSTEAVPVAKDIMVIVAGLVVYVVLVVLHGWLFGYPLI